MWWKSPWIICLVMLTFRDISCAVDFIEGPYEDLTSQLRNSDVGVGASHRRLDFCFSDINGGQEQYLAVY
jgi:hypothetical protein